VTADAHPSLLRRTLLHGSGALFLAPLGCEAERLGDAELWASAQGDEAGAYELVVAGPAGVRARIATAHSGRVVMFGRRPGRIGIVGDVASESVVARFESEAGRHQVGHGCFSADGSRLFVAVAEDVSGAGFIEVFDAQTFERVEEFGTHGVGPHEIALLPDGRTLAVANGGLVTEPGEREPINLDTMQSSLVYVDTQTGALLDEHRVFEPKASLRHLALAEDGTVVVVMQIQRDALADTDPRPLIAVHRPGGVLEVLTDGLELGTAMDDYAGAVALDDTARVAAVTSPRGNLVAYWNFDAGAAVGVQRFDDVSGVALSSQGADFVLSGSGGQIRQTDAATLEERLDGRVQFSNLRWDNHLHTVKT